MNYLNLFKDKKAIPNRSIDLKIKSLPYRTYGARVVKRIKIDIDW